MPQGAVMERLGALCSCSNRLLSAMAKAKWKDTSSYSYGERGNVEPSVWEIETGGLRIVVHRMHGITDDVWFGSCHQLAVDRVQLKGKTLADCQRSFLKFLKQRVWNWADKIAALEVP